MPLKNLLNLSNLTLLVALALSTVAAYYSIIGLTAIFAGAVIPVIIMGSILELGKITTTVWLRKYWSKCGFLLKLYLVPAVVALALLTSMGIFGFLSRAHIDAGVTSGDVQAKLALYDEKIKTQRDNIDLARKALQQMDAQVDARLSRGESEAGAERAVQIRRQQASERAKLQKEIGEAQKEIARLNEERAPIAAENRKVEAEVGPIKYVAALIYGDNPDSNLLEKAVRWVIILLVVVFDPLAIALVLAANSSKEWDKEVDDDKSAMDINPETESVTVRPFTEEELKALDGQEYKPTEGSTLWPTEWKEPEPIKEKVIEEKLPEPPINTIDNEKTDYTKYAYLNRPWSDKVPGIDRAGPQVYKPDVIPEPVETVDANSKNIEEKLESTQDITISESEESSELKPESAPTTAQEVVIETENVTKESVVKDLMDGYVSFENKVFSKVALKELRPDLFLLNADAIKQSTTNFGTEFPRVSNKGDIFVRVDVLPNKAFKFDGRKWIEINKQISTSYLYDEEYVKYLVNKISSGEYDIDMLTENEKISVEAFLNKNKS